MRTPPPGKRARKPRQEVIEQFLESVETSNAAQAEQYRAGKTQLLGFFVGQVMKASRGKADPQATREVLLEKL